MVAMSYTGWIWGRRGEGGTLKVGESEWHGLLTFPRWVGTSSMVVLFEEVIKSSSLI